MGLSGVVQAHDVISTKITWSREVSRIIFKSCVSCHHDGGSAFSLLNFDEARPWAKAIKEEVLARRMPPWNAVKGFGEFKDDRGLTQEQIEIIADWVEGGSPQGNPAYLPPKPVVYDSVPKAPKTPKIDITGNLTLSQSGEFVAIQAVGPVQVTAEFPDGTIEPVAWIRRFNPDFDGVYFFKSPLKLPPGSKIQITPAAGGSVALYAAK